MRSIPLRVLLARSRSNTCCVKRWLASSASSSSSSSLPLTAAESSSVELLLPQCHHHRHRHHHHRDNNNNNNHTVTPSASTSPTAAIHVRHALDQGCIDYTTGWAWQQCLLHRRLLAARRRRQQEQQLIDPHDAAAAAAAAAAGFDDYDEDTILLFQHQPVYTLGRGANEEHVTFLQNHPASEDESSSSSAAAARLRHALSRKGGSAKLALDQRMTQQLQSLLEQQQQQYSANYNDNHKNNNDRYIVQTILQQFVPQTKNDPSSAAVVAPNGAPMYRVERGGEVTFHGPGQLVVYPVVNLQQRQPPFKPDLHWFLYQLEQVLIETLRLYDITNATRDPIHTGVWVGERKIAAIGVAASRWITTHGFCLNVSPDLQYFDTSVILPCGVEDRAGVTSMAEILQERNLPVPSVEQVARVVLECMEQVFQVPLRDMESL